MMIFAIGIEHPLDMPVQCSHDAERITNQFLKRNLVVLAKADPMSDPTENGGLTCWRSRNGSQPQLR
jgi:hypothetical protein